MSLNAPKKSATRRKLSRFALHVGLQAIVIVIFNGIPYLCKEVGLVDLSTCLKMGPTLYDYFVRVWQSGGVLINGTLAIGQVTFEAIRFRKKTSEDWI